MKVFDLVKKYNTSSRTMIPKSVFMLLFFVITVFLGLLIFAGLGGAVLSASGLLGALLSIAVEFFFFFSIYILAYGLSLCNLRFVRNQPVAITFLFTGFKQKRAKKFAAFFIVPLVLAFAVTMAFGSPKLPEDFSQNTTAQAMVEYLAEHPEIIKAFTLQGLIFWGLLIVLLFPFTFTWSFVYDGTEQSFKALCSQSLKFWRGRILNFFGFEILAHYKKILTVLVCDFVQITLLKNFDGNALAEFISFIFGLVYCLAFVSLIASMILSVNFYYNEQLGGQTCENDDEKKSAVLTLQENNENPESESSN